MLEILGVIATSLFGYLMGSISPSKLIAKQRGIDLLEVGTKNPGTANVAVSMGIPLAALVLVLDMAKAIVPYWVARLLNPAYAFAGPLAGAFAVVGHVYPCWSKLKGGGRGLASLIGLCVVTIPVGWWAIIVLGCFALFAITNGSRMLIPLACVLYGIGAVVCVPFGSGLIPILGAVALVIAKNVVVIQGKSAGSENKFTIIFKKHD